MASQLVSVPVVPQSLECRVYQRHECEMPTTCQPASARDMEEMRWEAVIADISQGGVRLKLRRRFERGTPLAVELPGDGRREPMVVFVKVVYVRAQDDGRWALGCRFVSDLSEDEISRLLNADRYVLSPRREEIETPEAPEPEDTTPRVLFDVTVQIDVGRAEPVRCRIKRLDVSKCWPLTEGRILTIGGKSKDGTVWSFRIAVKRVEAAGAGWRLFSRLAESISDSGLFRVLERMAPQ